MNGLKVNAANYVGDGTPVNTTNYSVITTTDKQNFETTRYYHWTKNKKQKHQT